MTKGRSLKTVLSKGSLGRKSSRQPITTQTMRRMPWTGESQKAEKLLAIETTKRGRPKALCYEDILMMLVRHPVTGLAVATACHSGPHISSHLVFNHPIKTNAATRNGHPRYPSPLTTTLVGSSHDRVENSHQDPLRQLRNQQGAPNHVQLLGLDRFSARFCDSKV
jgi:hypothetical protein